MVSLSEKHEKLRGILRAKGAVAVAFSGGADSSFLLKTAVDELGENAFAVLVRSCLQFSEDMEHAKAVADGIGCRLIIHDVDPFFWPEFIANPPDRCYHCKKKIYSEIRFLACDEKMHLLDGTNSDDLLEERPGRRAIRELGVLTPLAEAGFTKAEVRRISRQVGLATWDRPSSSCLATRIPAGTPITSELLDMVVRCERFLLSLGFGGCRVRLDGRYASLELVENDMGRFVGATLRKKTIHFFSQLGIKKIFLNLIERPSVLY